LWLLELHRRVIFFEKKDKNYKIINQHEVFL